MAGFPKKLGIVAGGGYLPERLVAFCKVQNIPYFLIGFAGHTNPDLLSTSDSRLMRLGEAGSIVRILKEQNIHDLILIGSIERPSLWDLRPDFYTAAFFTSIGFRTLGDDGLLRAIRRKLEGDGFIIHGIHELIPDLLMKAGNMTRVVPDTMQMESITLGLTAARDLGRADIGQAVVVRGDAVVGRETVKGTDALIRLCGKSPMGRGQILVKTCKPQQDRKLDLPTIGPNTVRLCSEMGFAGIAAEAGSVLVVDEHEMLRLADEKNIFVVGV